MQKPQSVVSHHRANNEHVTHRVHKDGKGRGKSDPSPPPSPVKPPLRPVSGVGSRGGDERRAPNGLLDIQPQPMPNHGDTFSVFVEKPMSDVDDTMELLQEADMQNPKLELEKATASSVPERRSTHKSNIENTGVEENMDNINDTITLLKAAPIQHLHNSDIKVGPEKKLNAFFQQSVRFCF